MVELPHRLRDVLVHDEPLAFLLFKDHGPAEGGHFPLSAFQHGVLFHGRGGPDVFSGGVNLSVIIHGEGSALVVSEFFLHSFLILLPTAILERSDIEEGVRALSIELSHLRGVDRIPPIPDFLQVGLVGDGPLGSAFLADFLGAAMLARLSTKTQIRTAKKRFCIGFPPVSARNCRTGRRKPQRTRRDRRLPTSCCRFGFLSMPPWLCGNFCLTGFRSAR